VRVIKSRQSKPVFTRLLKHLRCSNLPRKIDGFALSHKSKMPWKVLLYREAHIWRMVELSKRAFGSFTSNQLVCGIVLTRAVLEVSAALWFLCAKVEAVVDSKVVGDVDEYLMKLAMGNATGWPENSAPGAGAMPRPVKVGKMLEQAEKDIEGFSHQYGVLSEYAYPNWAGCSALFRYRQANGHNRFWAIHAECRAHKSHWRRQSKCGFEDLSIEVQPDK
jgi:hypothetical protein